METQPDSVTVANLECIIMQQGELLCAGRSIGWFDDFKKYLHAKEDGSLTIVQLLLPLAEEHLKDLKEYQAEFAKTDEDIQERIDSAEDRIIKAKTLLDTK